MYKIISNSPQETEQYGEKVGQNTEPGQIICLSGQLGVGKTAFTKGLAKGLGIEGYITSPTFTIVNEYQGKYLLYHFDVYRVNDVDELYEIGFDEYIFGSGVSVIEWGELIESIIPNDRLWITINKDISKGDDYREIIFEPSGQRYKELVNKISAVWSESNEDTCS